MIYDVNGNAIGTLYDVEGDQLASAYDVEGNLLSVTQPTYPMTVMTFNVQWWEGINSNESMLRGIFEGYDPDIIGFQEFQKASADTIPTLAGTVLSADYPYVNMGNYGNKNALASKYQMTQFTTVPHTTQTMDGQSYSTAHITFHGKDILLLTSHLTTTSNEAAKVEQAHEVFEAVQDADYFIIFADFNTIFDTIQDTEYTTIMKQFVDAGYHCANCTAQHGFFYTWTAGTEITDPWSTAWDACDHIITSANISIDQVVADDTKITVAGQTGQSIDHLPLIAYLTVN